MEQDPTVVFEVTTCSRFYASDSGKGVSGASLWHVDIPTQLGTVTKKSIVPVLTLSMPKISYILRNALHQYGQRPLNLLKYDDDHYGRTGSHLHLLDSSRHKQ
jgi:hypothetical protein